MTNPDDKIVWPVCRYCSGNAIGLLDKQPDNVCMRCFQDNPYRTIPDVLQGLANVNIYDSLEIDRLKCAASLLLGRVWKREYGTNEEGKGEK